MDIESLEELPSDAPPEPLAGTAYFDHAQYRNDGCCGWQRYFNWYGLQHMPLEYLVSVDLSNIYRRHLVWSKSNGDELLRLVTARFTSTTVFLSLMVNAQIGVFFSPCDVVTNVRHVLQTNDYYDRPIMYAAGITLSVGTYISLCGLLANFTAWSVFVVLSKENAAVVLRSRIGLYAANLPAQIAVVTIYIFFAWLALFWFIVLPGPGALALTLTGILIIVHIASTFSAVGRIIMGTSAMADDPILNRDEAEKLSPDELNDLLVHETHLGRKAAIKVQQQYRMNYHEVVRSQAPGRTGFLRQRFPSVKSEDRVVRRMEEGRGRQ